MNNQARVYNELVALSIFLGQKQDERRLKMYVDRLIGFDVELVINAIQKCSEDCEFFPQLVKILEKINPPEVNHKDLTEEITGKIFGEIRHMNEYAPLSSPIVREYLDIINDAGGVSYLCSQNESNGEFIKSNIRNAVSSFLAREKNKKQKEDLKKIGANNGLVKVDFNNLIGEKE